MRSFFGIFSRASFAGGGASSSISRRTITAPVVLATLAAFVCAIFTGYIAASFQFKMMVALLVGIALTWSLIRWPRWGLVLILAVMSTVAAPEFFGWIADTKVVYWATEGLLLLIVATSLVYWVRSHPETTTFQRLYSSPQSIAITIFFGVVLIKAMAVMIERRFAPGSISQMYSFNRGLTFFLLFIPILLLLDTTRRQRWMVGVLYVLGSVVMVRVLLELLFPDWSLFTYISLSQPLAEETPYVDLTVQRLRAPGGTIVLACFWIGMMNIILRSWTVRRLAFYVPFTLVMLTGMILEFNRSYIIPMAGLLVLSTLLGRKNVRVKLLTVFAALVLALVIIATFTGVLQNYLDAAATRYGSAFSSQSLQSQSVTSRQIEQDYAWESIKGAMIFGIGLDEYYRPPVPGMLDNLRWYIHNSYIWFWTYFGLVGLVAFLGMIGTAVIRSVINWKRISDPLLQTALLGCGFSLTTLLAANFAAPKFYDYATVPVVAVMLGMVEVIILRERHRDSTSL
ncbi:MAG: O-antigen ligase family protein [Thermoleophilia bacterium]